MDLNSLRKHDFVYCEQFPDNSERQGRVPGLAPLGCPGDLPPVLGCPRGQQVWRVHKHAQLHKQVSELIGHSRSYLDVGILVQEFDALFDAPKAAPRRIF